VITHEHADHLHGIDDLRPYCFVNNKTINVYTHQECAQNMKIRFPYIFDRGDQEVIGGGIPRLALQIVSDQQDIEGLSFEFFLLPHGHTETLGFIIGNFAYAIDCQALTDEFIKRCSERKLDYLIIDCVKEIPHQTHLYLPKTLEYIKQIQPKKAGLIHMGHEFEHSELTQKLSSLGHDNVEVLYDGQQLKIR
jgi:phosphoribosyl 1,2-cyclic phosphate phosphodiesterase